jgi:hypothetical protein
LVRPAVSAVNSGGAGKTSAIQTVNGSIARRARLGGCDNQILEQLQQLEHVHDHVNVHVDVHVIVDVAGFFVTTGYILPASWAFIRLPASTV